MNIHTKNALLIGIGILIGALLMFGFMSRRGGVENPSRSANPIVDTGQKKDAQGKCT